MVWLWCLLNTINEIHSRICEISVDVLYAGRENMEGLFVNNGDLEKPNLRSVHRSLHQRRHLLSSVPIFRDPHAHVECTTCTVKPLNTHDEHITYPCIVNITSSHAHLLIRSTAVKCITCTAHSFSLTVTRRTVCLSSRCSVLLKFARTKWLLG